jgi:hypothetical protein
MAVTLVIEKRQRSPDGAVTADLATFTGPDWSGLMEAFSLWHRAVNCPVDCTVDYISPEYRRGADEPTPTRKVESLFAPEN